MPEPYRPRFHFSPRRNWINDPNGLVWFDGEYHLFFQYNPMGTIWGHMSWGHAVSTDLMRWTQLPVAIPEDERNMIYSGSVVCDATNASGLGPDTAPLLVAIYTGDQRGEPKRQTQNLAASADRGRTWTKYAGNPVLDIDREHFRDPKVFWHAPSGRWVMIIALSDVETLQLFASQDLKTWTFLSAFGPAGSGGTLWECPDLFALPTPGAPGEETWVLKVDVFSGGVAGGSSAQYFVGAFDGVTFTPRLGDDGRPLWGWADWGHDFYAAVTWSNLPATAPGPLWIGWMSNHGYGPRTPTSPWRGAMTLPRRLALAERGGVPVLVQQPALEVEALRGAPVTTLAPNGPAAALSVTFDPSDGPPGLELHARIEAGGARLAGVRLAWSSGDEVRIGLDRAAGELFVDRSRSGLMTDEPGFADVRRAPVPAVGQGGLDLRVFVDTASVEVFADGGAVVITEQIFPRGVLASLSGFAADGEARLADVAIWPLVV